METGPNRNHRGLCILQLQLHGPKGGTKSGSLCRCVLVARSGCVDQNTLDHIILGYWHYRIVHGSLNDFKSLAPWYIDQCEFQTWVSTHLTQIYGNCFHVWTLTSCAASKKLNSVFSRSWSAMPVVLKCLCAVLCNREVCKIWDPARACRENYNTKLNFGRYCSGIFIRSSLLAWH